MSSKHWGKFLGGFQGGLDTRSHGLVWEQQSLLLITQSAIPPILLCLSFLTSPWVRKDREGSPVLNYCPCSAFGNTCHLQMHPLDVTFRLLELKRPPVKMRISQCAQRGWLDGHLCPLGLARQDRVASVSENDQICQTSVTTFTRLITTIYRASLCV
jgi:hypothetical protein